jgi:hypothetical protein
MIVKSHIQKNIIEIDNLYNKSSSSYKNQLYYSKLALLELCGWIEESMDIIILEFAKRNLKLKKNIKEIEESTKKNSSFDYEHNFRRLLVNIIGLINVEMLENNLDQIKYQKLKAALNNLKTVRNSEAHTHLKGVTKTIDAPSVTMKHFLDVNDGLKEFESKLRTMRF